MRNQVSEDCSFLEETDHEQYKQVMDDAVERFANNANVSVEDFNEAMNTVLHEGHFGYPDIDAKISFGRAKEILCEAVAGSKPRAYSFKDEDGNRRTVSSSDQTVTVFRQYLMIYDCLPW